MGERIKVLVTVKTYPLPSESHGELVCTAGVREDGSFIRLYPIDYRMRPYWQWYKKYQWIELEVEKNLKDPRPESYRPVGEIMPVGEPLPTKNCWVERKRYVFGQGVRTMCKLEGASQRQCSLGITRPSQVLDFKVEAIGGEWKPGWGKLFRQKLLFGPQQKLLEKIPYKFSYIFKCAERSCKGHTKMIADWEVGQLYRSMRDKFGSEKIAVEKVKKKFLGQICADGIDTHFFVGTILGYGAWVILGVFWPKKEG